MRPRIEGERKSIRMGQHNKRQCEEICRHVEDLVAPKVANDSLPVKTTRWLKGIGTPLRAKLESLGIVEPEKVTQELTGFVSYVDRFIKHGRTRDGDKAAEKTIEKWTATRGVVNEFFGYAALTDIEPKQAVELRQFMEEEKEQKPNTYRRHIANCKLFFNAAVKDGLVSSNPFNGIKSASIEDRSNDHWVSGDDTSKMLAATDDHVWKMVIALTRYGVLRCPSEVVLCRWDDVLWDQHKLLIRSPKTERYDGGASRHIPLSPELAECIREAQAAAPEGSTLMVPGRDGRSN